MAFSIGETVGDFRVIGLLGAGGMGQVYKVENLISGRVEAMKVLLPDLTGEPELAERFMREIKVQASLQHPNIAALHTALKSGNQLLMIIELVEGVSLEARMNSAPIRLSDALAYMCQALAALGYAHEHGVVHRDIKPANMILTPEGQLKLLDFGIAKSSQNEKITMTGSTIGSVPYMSPEQIRGEPVDPRSDLYSLAVALYEIVTGVRPFQGDGAYATMKAHLEQPPRPPIEMRPDLPAELSRVIVEALSKDPRQRPQSAALFRRQLESVSWNTGTEHLSATGVFDQNAISTVEQSLTRELGPIAQVLVRAAGQKTTDVVALCKTLAQEIHEDSARHRFMERCEKQLGLPPMTLSVEGHKPPSAQPPTPARLDASILERAKKHLSSYIGPLAKVVVERAAKKAGSADQLYHLLGAEIDSVADRQKFLASRPDL